MRLFQKTLYIILISGLALIAAACTPGTSDPSDPVVGDPSTVIATSTIDPGSVCTYGGILVESGIDDNGNNVLDPNEVDVSEPVCNGADGTPGTDGTDGTDGTNGSNSLISMTVEPGGANCFNGGVLIEAGVDDTGDGILDPAEVDATQYVCAPLTADQQASTVVEGGTRTFTGSIDATDPQFGRGDGCAVSATTTYYYDTHTVINSTTTYKEVLIRADWSGDGYLKVNSGTFDPADPATNCVFSNDNYASTSNSQVTPVTIPPGGTIVIVASTFSAASATGPYTLRVADLAGATTVTLDAVARGRYDAAGAGNGVLALNNTFTGQVAGSNMSRSYFVFDLSTVSGMVTGSALDLEVENYLSSDISETITFYDVSSDLVALVAGTGGATAYSDLGGGISYTSGAFTSANVGFVVSMTGGTGMIVDADAAVGGDYAIGAAATSLSGQTLADEGVRFSNNVEARTHQLVLTVIP